MKHFIKRLTITLALVTVLAVSAFAADFTHCADALKDLGLFSGTQNGYELDRAPTRAEAAAMLVRLLGEETAAKALPYSAPFTDVPTWAQPYVQYLYDNGLTAGKTDTTFDSFGKCTAQMYATFLMRALGYSDQEGGDFTYATAVTFATEKGVANTFNCDEKNFLRDDVVAMSYTALATATSDGASNLLAKLMKAGVITDAKGYDAQFNAYNAYIKATTADTAAATKAHMKADVTMAAKIGAVDFMSGSFNMDMLIDLNTVKMDSSKIAMTGKLDLKINPAIVPEDNTMVGDFSFYFADGVSYTNMLGEKVKQTMSLDAMMAQLGTLATTSAPTEPLCMIKTISVKDGVYAISYAGSSFNGIIDSAMAAVEGTLGAGAPAVEISKIDIATTIQGNKATKTTMDMGMSMTIEGQKVDMTMKMTMTDVGGTVTVTLPTDLNTYVEQVLPAA